MEEWKIANNSGGNYEVSSLGRIRNKNTGKILKSGMGKNGYCKVTFAYGINKCFLVHRLVAKAFIENTNNFPVVNHKDENRTNNRASNLEWCTTQYNVTYGEGGLARNHKIIQRKKDGSFVREWDSLKEAAETLGIKYQGISRVCRGERKSSRGFLWEYSCKEKALTTPVNAIRR